MWFLSFIVSDSCLDHGGRVGRTWAECEIQLGEVAAWSDYVGIFPVVASVIIWVGLWAASHRLIASFFRREN
jgi:hypothetical protein